MADPTQWAGLIRSLAPKYGLDPNAVMSVAQMEGMSGNVGDGGHAFGPFQLNDAGGVLTNRPGDHRSFAESPQGIDWAMQRISNVARGQHGAQAINSIVRRFERPADPNAEVRGAVSRYGGQDGSPLGGSIPSPQGATGGLSDGSDQAMASMLLGMSQQAQQGQGLNPSGLLAMAQQRQQGQAAQTMFGPSPAANQITQVASHFLGVPYRWGGSDNSGMDCSAFIQRTYAKVGINLPRTTQEQVKVGQAVNLNNLQPGDAIFTEPGKTGPKHVGMYIGNGRVQESPHTGDVNKVIPLQAFLSGGFVAARRYAK